MESNITNFTRNRVKIVEPQEIFFGGQYRAMAQEMAGNGVLFVSGKKEDKLIEYYAAIYKGEAIEEFTCATKNEFALRYWRLKGESLINILDHLLKTKYLKLKPSWLPERIIATKPTETVTLLGNYLKDTKRVLNELDYSKNTNFGAKQGEFNLLNVPDEKIKNFSTFWEDFNQPWLKLATERGDDVIVLSNKFDQKLLYKSTGEITGFGKEIKFMDELVKKGVYKFLKVEGKYIKVKK